MTSHEKNTPDELQLLTETLTEGQVAELPHELRVALAIEDPDMQRVFSKGEFLEGLSQMTDLPDNVVRKSIIKLRDEKEGYLRYIPEESRMVLGSEGRQWVAGRIIETIEER